MDINSVTFGRNISAFRRSKQESLEEFGKRLNLSTSQMSYYETGQATSVKIPFLINLAKLMGCTLDDLFNKDMSTFNPPSPSNPDGTPPERNRPSTVALQYSSSSSASSLAVVAATESPPIRDGTRATESPPPKDTEIVNDVGKEEIRQLRRQAIETLRRLDILETHVVE